MTRYRAEVELHGKTATGIRVPPAVVDEFGAGKKPRVLVTIGGYTYRTTVAVYGGGFMLALSAANREAAGVHAGDTIEVDLELDVEERTVSVPDDLAAALADSPGASAAFDALSYTHRRERVDAVDGAKRVETRQRRISRIVEDLTQPRNPVTWKPRYLETPSLGNPPCHLETPLSLGNLPVT